MTDGPAAIQASFSDFRLIKGRKVCQLVLEIPIEGADAALAALGGIPQPHAESWVGVARLNGVAKSEPEPKKKREWNELQLSVQAGIRCEEKAFHDYLGVTRGSASQAADEVRSICGVDSRSGLNNNPEAAAKWNDLDRSYQAWLKVAE